MHVLLKPLSCEFRWEQQLCPVLRSCSNLTLNLVFGLSRGDPGVQRDFSIADWALLGRCKTHYPRPYLRQGWAQLGNNTRNWIRPFRLGTFTPLLCWKEEPRHKLSFRRQHGRIGNLLSVLVSHCLLTILYSCVSNGTTRKHSQVDCGRFV